MANELASSCLFTHSADVEQHWESFGDCESNFYSSFSFLVLAPGEIFATLLLMSLLCLPP